MVAVQMMSREGRLPVVLLVLSVLAWAVTIGIFFMTLGISGGTVLFLLIFGPLGFLLGCQGRLWVD